MGFAYISLGYDLSGATIQCTLPAGETIPANATVVRCIGGATIKQYTNGRIIATDAQGNTQTLRNSSGTPYTVTLPADFGVVSSVSTDTIGWQNLIRTSDAKVYGVTGDQGIVPLADAVHVETLKQTITQVGAGGALTVKHRLTALALVVPGYRPVAVIGYSFASSDTRDSYLDDFISFMCDFYLRVNSAGKYAVDYTCAFINNTANAIYPRVWFDILYLPV